MLRLATFPFLDKDKQVTQDKCLCNNDRLDFLVNITRKGEHGRKSLLIFSPHLFHVNTAYKKKKKKHVPTTSIPENSRQKTESRVLLNLVCYQTRWRKSTAVTQGGGSCRSPYPMSKTTRNKIIRTAQVGQGEALCCTSSPLSALPSLSLFSYHYLIRQKCKKTTKKKTVITNNSRAVVFLNSVKAQHPARCRASQVTLSAYRRTVGRDDGGGRLGVPLSIT